MKTIVITAIKTATHTNIMLVHGMTVDTYEPVAFTTDTSVYKELELAMNTAKPIKLNLQNIIYPFYIT